MTLPANLTTVTVVGRYLAPDGAAHAGRVTFRPLVDQAVDLVGRATILGAPVTVTLDDQGAFTVTLLVGDDTDVLPTGWAYEVHEEFTATTMRRTYQINLTSDLAPGPVDITELAPLTATPTPVTPGPVTSVDGRVGNVALDEMNHPLSLRSSFAGGEDDGLPGQFDSTSRLNLYSYQRADVGSYGETLRHFLMRKDAKAMEAWYFPSGGYDASRNPVGTMKPVVWAGAHWEANNHASNHKHWSVETPDSTGAIQTRFEVRWGNPLVDGSIAGLDKTLIMTNLADLVVRCTNGQELRLSAPAGTEKGMTFSHDSEGADQYRRWKIRATNETESGGNAGTNFQLVRYDDTGAFVDNPIVVSRSSGNVTLGPGFIARRSTSSVSTLSLNSSSLGGGQGVIAVGNAATPPASNPTGGGVLYAEGGALKWRGSSGTVTVIAPA